MSHTPLFGEITEYELKGINNLKSIDIHKTKDINNNDKWFIHSFVLSKLRASHSIGRCDNYNCIIDNCGNVYIYYYTSGRYCGYCVEQYHDPLMSKCKNITRYTTISYNIPLYDSIITQIKNTGRSICKDTYYNMEDINEITLKYREKNQKLSEKIELNNLIKELSLKIQTLEYRINELENKNIETNKFIEYYKKNN